MLSATVVTPGHSKVVPLGRNPSRPKNGREARTANATPSGAGLPSMARGSAPFAPRVPRRRSVRLPPRRQDDHDAGDDFIFTCKPTSHKTLYDFIDETAPPPRGESPRRNTKETLRYRWIEAVRCATARTRSWSTGLVSRLTQGQGRIYSIALRVTSLPVSRDNVAEIVACGRARWKIENESFNVLKNRRLRREHDSGAEVSRDDAGGPQSARLRLAHRARTARTTLAGRSRSGGRRSRLSSPTSSC